jgi:hypothetical protein
MVGEFEFRNHGAAPADRQALVFFFNSQAKAVRARADKRLQRRANRRVCSAFTARTL